MSTENKTDDAQTENSEESVDDMLANVDHFIQSVYRDLNINSSERHTTHLSNNSSFVSSENTPDRTSTSSLSFRSENGAVSSPTTRRNLDAEIERINQICDDVNENLRSVGVFMNRSNDSNSSNDLLNINLISSPSSSSTSFTATTSNTPQLQALAHRQRNIPYSSRSAVDQVIDLSDSQSLGQNNAYVGANNDDDDIIVVFENLNPVVDLCTPCGHQEDLNSRISAIYQRNFNRRRLADIYVDEDADTSFRESSSTRKRRAEFFTPPESIVNNKKTSNNVASGHTPFMCPVCMESCLQRQPTSTRCGHVFCKECIEQALRLNRKCPMCNSKISKSQIFRIYI